MHIEKIQGQPTIQDIPENLKVIAFGQHGGINNEHYFAFLAPNETRLEPAAGIDGVCYAEGFFSKGTFTIKEEVVVKTRRNEDGSYIFLVCPTKSNLWVRFFISQENSRQPTCDYFPIKLISLYPSE